MGITSRRMEGTARHMELPSTTTILSNCSYKYEYMFAYNGASGWWLFWDYPYSVQTTHFQLKER